ncbi:Metallo-hydrolase/oxidoreductase [Glonium stellatum]|uniref:Metallo-hydrolase/oxidoreductase n=1 Tax=Glonium stellatum TaxID=574774 RepID=A0A8E2F4E1_9PEZI|nr:Metallo-hydrolase/oxidoreductase [Glonium stellatum]
MSTLQEWSLPEIRSDKAFVTVSPVEGGFITLPEKAFVAPVDLGARRTVPSLAFLITHPGLDDTGSIGIGTSRRPLRLMFDLGTRSEVGQYLPEQQAHLKTREPHRLGPGVVKHLATGNIAPEDIDIVMYSHIHWDHHGDPENFPTSKFLVGSGSLNVLKYGLPGKGSHQFFDPDLLPMERTLELPSAEAGECQRAERSWKWNPIGPFPAGLDLFGDGSIYVIDAPGHLPGHVNLLCRTGPGRWVCLCGDAYHDKRLLTGEKEIGTWMDEHGGTLCIHLDKRVAEESIRRLRELAKLEYVEIIAAHDLEWYEQNKERLFPRNL